MLQRPCRVDPVLCPDVGCFDVPQPVWTPQLAPSNLDDPNSFICITWSDSQNDSSFSNGFAQATIGASAGSIAGILMRENIVEGADYEFWRNTMDGTFFIGRFDFNADPQFELLASTEENAVPYEEGEQWIIEAGVVDNQLSLKYWHPGDQEPLDPRLMAEDEVFPSFGDASVLSLAVHHVSTVDIVMSAAFDDVFFTEVVPEPSTFALVLLGFPAFATRRFIRRKVNAT